MGKRYRIDMVDGRLVCVDPESGKPAGMDKCISIGADDDGVHVSFNKDRCEIGGDADSQLVERVKKGSRTIWGLSDGESFPHAPRKKKADP